MAETVQPRAPHAGRPRDPSIDDRVLAATRELLVETGWEATSIRAVASRAEVSRAALQRRWSSKAHLVLDAVLGAAPDLELFDGVDLEGWVRGITQASVEIFARPEVRAAAPGLIAALREQPELRDRMWHTFTGEPVAVYVDQHGGDPGEAALEAKALIVLAAGAALFAATLAGPDDTPALHDRIQGLLLAGSPIALTES